MYGALLCPVDGSACADAAADHAISLAAATGGTLHFLYVVDVRYAYADTRAPGDERAERSTDVTAGMQSRGEAVLEGVVERASAEGVSATSQIRVGVPHESIVNYASEHGVDLVVIGTHGESGLLSGLLGSTTDRVVRTASVPVLSVREDPEAAVRGESGSDVGGDTADEARSENGPGDDADT